MGILPVVFLIVSFVLAIVARVATAEIFALWAIATALLLPTLRALF
jgi:hypothetical protein